MNATTDQRLTGKTASNLQAIRIGEYDSGICRWHTLDIMSRWGSFRALATFRVRTFTGDVAGPNRLHVY